MRQVTKVKLITAILLRMVSYNSVEVLWAIALSITYYSGAEVWPLVLWSGFILSASHVLSTSMAYTQEFAKELVLGRQLFFVDFLSGSVIHCVLAWIVRHEDWQFSVMFLLAAVQHLRYTCLSFKWLIEQKEAHEQHSNDNM